jgi:cation diffusion facilitator family transporter
MPTDPYRLLTPRRMLVASVVVAIITIALKTAAWHVTGSVGLLSDALESVVNLGSAAFGLAMVTIAARPPDAEHPYGHHKAEYFSSGFEGILIIVAALGIFWTAAERLLHPQAVQSLDLGLVLSVVSSALNGLLAWVMFGAARAHRSIALHADARHLRTDVWTSVGVVLGLVLVALTGWLWLDPVIAMAVAINIVREGLHLVWRSSQGLLDEALEPQDLETVHTVLDRFTRAGDTGQDGGYLVRFDHIVSRKAGQRLFLDLHMHLPGRWSLARAAALRGEVELALMQAVPGLRVSIQMLPGNVETLQEDVVH